MMTKLKWLSVGLCMGLFSLFCTATAAAETYKVAWSHYTGWEPWGYAQDSGIVDKWAEKYNVDIKVELINDYVESINLYTSGSYVGVTVTNMDALAFPAVGGVDSSFIIVGDFSNGNDGIVSSDVNDVCALKGKEVKLVELSVSHYLLARALESCKLSERDLAAVVNTSDADIGSVFLSQKKQNIVTWNPILLQVQNARGANLLFDSASIPGEIIDGLIVRNDTPEAVKKALVGAWYETMSIMSGRGKTSQAAIQFMAEQAGGTEQEFKAQLKTTAMLYQPAEAVSFMRSDDLPKTMDYVRNFSFDHGIYGDGAPSADIVGIEFPNGDVLGSKGNIKLRFDDTYMQMAADGKL